MAIQDNSALSVKRNSYSPEQTAEIKRNTINEIVDIQSKLLEQMPTRTDLSDLSAVRAVAFDCMTKCAEAGIIPSFEMLAAALGYSRRGLYAYIERNPDTSTTDFIDRLRTAWAACRIAAADRGAVGETMSIFVLLNSSLGFSNQHQIEISATTDDALDHRSVEEIREFYLHSLPEPIEE